MVLAPLLLVTTMMAAPGAPPEQVRAVPPPPPSTTTQSGFAIGGGIVAGSNGVTGGVQYWFGPRVAMDLSVGYYRLPNYYTTGSSASTFQVAPSVVVMLTPPNQSRDVDFRPYVGGGISYVTSSAGTSPTTAPGTVPVTSGMGSQAFGGVEMSFKDTPQLGVTFEISYYHLPAGFVGNGYIGGVNYLLGVHFYLK